MKISLLVLFLTTVSIAWAASITDGNGVAATVKAAAPTEAASLEVNPVEGMLGGVSADGLLDVPQALAVQSPTTVPESAAAGFIALFGYILMLRRRTA